MNLGGGSTVPITIAWIVTVVAALFNRWFMGNGKTLDGRKHTFGRYASPPGDVPMKNFMEPRR